MCSEKPQEPDEIQRPMELTDFRDFMEAVFEHLDLPPFTEYQEKIIQDIMDGNTRLVLRKGRSRKEFLPPELPVVPYLLIAGACDICGEDEHAPTCPARPFVTQKLHRQHYLGKPRIDPGAPEGDKDGHLYRCTACPATFFSPAEAAYHFHDKH